MSAGQLARTAHEDRGGQGRCLLATRTTPAASAAHVLATLREQEAAPPPARPLRSGRREAPAPRRTTPAASAAHVLRPRLTKDARQASRPTRAHLKLRQSDEWRIIANRATRS